jgi:hypothetical protein
MGYTAGLNMFPIPYDFRHDAYHTDAANQLVRTIKYAYEMSG